MHASRHAPPWLTNTAVISIWHFTITYKTTLTFKCYLHMVAHAFLGGWGNEFKSLVMQRLCLKRKYTENERVSQSKVLTRIVKGQTEWEQLTVTSQRGEKFMTSWIYGEMANIDMSIRLFNNDYNYTYIFMSLWSITELLTTIQM